MGFTFMPLRVGGECHTPAACENLQIEKCYWRKKTLTSNDLSNLMVGEYVGSCRMYGGYPEEQEGEKSNNWTYSRQF
jgi:hypothetical protein